MRPHLCALLVALSLPSLALADPQLPSFETLNVVRGIEWGDYHPQIDLTLTKQPDGSYRVEVAGEDFPNPPQGLVAQESDLTTLKQALWAMRGFAAGQTFAGEGNHWYTDVELTGTQPDGSAWNLDLWFFDSNSPAVSQKVNALEEAARALVKGLQSGGSTAPQLPSFETLRVVRGIEWGGYHAQIELTLTKQADGSYQVAVSGDDYPTPPQGLVAQEADLAPLKQALWDMRVFGSGTSFGGDGNHWYTEVELKGKQPDGKDWDVDLWFFDANSRSVSDKVSALENAARNLVDALTPAPATPAPAPSGGIAGALGAGQ